MADKSSSRNRTDAVFMYMGILDAYEAISEELIGENVLQEHVLPRMIYYVKNFLPNVIQDQSEEELVEELGNFLSNLRTKVYQISFKKGSYEDITMDEVWELRAAIFGFENVFLDILGQEVIESYVYQRIADILSVYLPDIFSNDDLTVEEKLEMYSKYLKENNFVREANFSVRNDKIEYRVNRCAFANIHGSSAYLDGQTRFCPWGMIGNAILSTVVDQENKLRSCKFTTRGSITELEILGDDK